MASPQRPLRPQNGQHHHQPTPSLDQRSFELVHDGDIRLSANEVANITSAINRALHKEGIEGIRVDRVRCTDTRRILGTTTPTSTLQGLLAHRDLVLRAARTVDNSIRDVAAQQKWMWIRIHDVSLGRYMGGTDGGLRRLREELEAENDGVRIPADIRWLSRAKAQARYRETRGGSSAVVAAVLGEATFGRLCRSGVRLIGRKHEIDAYQEARPDVCCGRCSAWGHIAPHCKATAPRCGICAKDHATDDHRCPVEGCRTGRGRPCPHGTARCANCQGPHGARADVCKAKREARQAARGWRSPSPPRRERGAKAPEAPVTAVPGAPAAEEGGSVEVEMESAVAPEEMEE